MVQKQTVVSNFIWRFAERCGAQGISFVVSMVLARILAPELYGTIALVNVFIGILQVFVDSGMANALIQKKNADELDFSTVFYFNMAVCILLYGLMCLAAPWIAAFYKDETLTPVIRVLSFTLVISGLKNVQQAYVSRHMLFKRFFFATLGGTIGAAVIGIWMACKGFGVWALVAQQLFNTTMDTLILWFTVRWHPQKGFSFHRLRGMFSFGSKMLLSSLLDTFYSQMRSLLIGKIYTSADLAYYNRGNQVPNLLIQNVNTSVTSVLFPAMSMEQDETARVKSMTRRAIRVSSFIIWPMMVGLGVCAPALVRLVLTEKWLPCVPYLRIFCFSYGLWPVHTANLSALKALGRSDVFVRLEVIKKVVGIFVLTVSLPYGVFAIVLGEGLTAPIGAFINSTPNVKLLGYRYREQLSDIAGPILLSAAMGVLAASVSFFRLNDIMTLVCQVLIGVVSYILLSKYFYSECFEYVFDIIKGFCKKLSLRTK